MCVVAAEGGGEEGMISGLDLRAGGRMIDEFVVGGGGGEGLNGLHTPLCVVIFMI